MLSFTLPACAPATSHIQPCVCLGAQTPLAVQVCLGLHTALTTPLRLKPMHSTYLHAIKSIPLLSLTPAAYEPTCTLLDDIPQTTTAPQHSARSSPPRPTAAHQVLYSCFTQGGGGRRSPSQRWSSGPGASRSVAATRAGWLSASAWEPARRGGERRPRRGGGEGGRARGACTAGRGCGGLGRCMCRGSALPSRSAPATPHPSPPPPKAATPAKADQLSPHPTTSHLHGTMSSAGSQAGSQRQ
jgi:hypothetical protein